MVRGAVVPPTGLVPGRTDSWTNRKRPEYLYRNLYIVYNNLDADGNPNMTCQENWNRQPGRTNCVKKSENPKLSL